MSFFNNDKPVQWSATSKLVLRFFFVYFFIQAVPLDWKFYKEIFTTNWLHASFFDWFKLTTYSPRFFGLSGYANWLVAAILAVAGAFIWKNVEKNKSVDDDRIYYWLRVILRYRLAIGVIAFGLIKLFPLQMPYPSLSNLHTNYGDFLPWKIYFHTLGIAQPYEVFLGTVEVVAGLLLLNRKTATFGAGIVIGFTGNIFVANLAYDIGQDVYSLYLTLLAIALFAYDAPRLYSLLIVQKQTIANKYQPAFTAIQSGARVALKVLAAIFIVVLSVSTYANYSKHPYKLPQTAGLKGSYGYYNVRTFKLNNVEIPYSVTDSNRWQNVVFEKWATISIKTARPIVIDNSIGDEYREKDIDRNYESAGVGGRRYFAYGADTVNHVLELANKNKHHKAEKFTFHYQFVNDSTIVLNGVNEKRDSIYAVLEKINRKYMLYEGRRKPVKL
ncbi:DoxX family protein [Pedobacter sp. BS3]|uniref:DoxX family protein n=1 Tax=Pedobacter sp. BS3 TaxID=2567937 RepID=UPI0011EEF2A9|nr:DoxX family protein [Pedobacter sp. BS3]TZF82202.1 DoxX family protein [Pedobacter sp. BS3]